MKLCLWGPNWLRPDDIDQPRADLGHDETGASGGVGASDPQRAIVELEVCQLHKCAGQRAPVVEDLHGQHTIGTQRIGIAQGDDLERQPERARCNAIVSDSCRSDLNKRLGPSAVQFPPIAIGRSTAGTRINSGCKSLDLYIVVEPDRWQVASCVGRHETDHVQAGLAKRPRQMRNLPAGFEQGAQVCAAAIDRKILQRDQMTAVDAPLLAERPMSDFYHERHRRTKRGLPTPRLQPEIVGRGAAGQHERNQKPGVTNHHEHLFARVSRVVGYSAAAVSLLVIAGPALAHAGTGLPGGFIAGVEHPLSGPDHMLAMASVGLWGHFLGRPLIYLLPMVFPIMMAIGAGVGIAGVKLPPVELGIAVSVCVLGALILGAVRAPVPVACAVVGLFALFHGYAHGLELPSAADPIGYSLGFVGATGSLHVAGIAFGSLAQLPRGQTMLRGVGGVVLLIGLWFLWNAWP